MNTARVCVGIFIVLGIIAAAWFIYKNYTVDTGAAFSEADHSKTTIQTHRTSLAPPTYSNPGIQKYALNEELLEDTFQTVGGTMLGNWEDTKDGFTLGLDVNPSGVVYGEHMIVVRGGSHVDNGKGGIITVLGSRDGNIARVNYISSFEPDMTGSAIVTYDPATDSIHWKVVGEAIGYFPDEATLTRRLEH